MKRFALIILFILPFLILTVPGCGGGGGGGDGSGSTFPNTVLDGGFETGTPNSFWIELSTNYGTPICDVGSCGTGTGTGPYQGQYWAWFGGGNYEDGIVSQNVTIMVGANTLRFYIELPACETGSWDWFEITIDGNQVYFMDGNDPQCNSVGYQVRNVNIAAYADGGVHTIQFRGTNDSSNTTNFFVDNVQLVCD
jgi:hypothetical protein